MLQYTVRISTSVGPICQKWTPELESTIIYTPEQDITVTSMLITDESGGPVAYYNYGDTPVEHGNTIEFDMEIARAVLSGAAHLSIERSD